MPYYELIDVDTNYIVGSMCHPGLTEGMEIDFNGMLVETLNSPILNDNTASGSSCSQPTFSVLVGKISAGTI